MKSFIKKFIPKQILNNIKTFLKKVLPDWIFEKVYHAIFWPILGSIIYRFPSRKIKVIGVTGTNGKTTVVHLATHILENAGYRVASISSLRFKIANKEWKNTLKMTMPGRMKLQRFLMQAVSAKCDFVVLEVTSEGIMQNRHRFIKFDTTVFTNLTKEHIESHGSFEKYRYAKTKLFALPHRVSVVNLDDKNAEKFLKYDTKQKIGYSIKGIEAAGVLPSGFQEGRTPLKITRVLVEDINMKSTGSSFRIDDTRFYINLPGEFNVSNSLAAISIALAQKLTLEKIKKALFTFPGIPGRMEVVITKPYKVIVDYAHTPDALEKVYKTIEDSYKLQATSYKLICVLGAAGGGRDKWKRSEFGRIASKYCGRIILTDEDPYDEDPGQILSEIEFGISNFKFSISKILNRRQAIYEGLKMASDGDVVIVTGKGAEPLMMTKNGPIDWDDRMVVREEFGKLD